MEFKKKYKNKLRFIMPNQRFVHEARYLSLNVDKAKKFLRWQPKWTVKKAIKYTYEWYEALENKNKKKIQLLTKNQINNYMRL